MTALSRGSRDRRLDATLTFSTAVGPISVELHTTGQLNNGSGVIDRILGSR